MLWVNLSSKSIPLLLVPVDFLWKRCDTSAWMKRGKFRQLPHLLNRHVSECVRRRKLCCRTLGSTMPNLRTVISHASQRRRSLRILSDASFIPLSTSLVANSGTELSAAAVFEMRLQCAIGDRSTAAISDAKFDGKTSLRSSLPVVTRPAKCTVIDHSSHALRGGGTEARDGGSGWNRRRDRGLPPNAQRARRYRLELSFPWRPSSGNDDKESVRCVTACEGNEPVIEVWRQGRKVDPPCSPLEEREPPLLLHPITQPVDTLFVEIWVHNIAWRTALGGIN